LSFTFIQCSDWSDGPICGDWSETKCSLAYQLFLSTWYTV